MEEDLKRAHALFPRLEQRAGQLAEMLSGGEQQTAAMARAVMASPALVMLDEPPTGLAPLVVELGALRTSRTMRQRGRPPRAAGALLPGRCP